MTYTIEWWIANSIDLGTDDSKVDLFDPINEGRRQIARAGSKWKLPKIIGCFNKLSFLHSRLKGSISRFRAHQNGHYEFQKLTLRIIDSA